MAPATADRSAVEFELRSLPGIDAVRDEWTALAHAGGNPFLTPEWCDAWLRLGCPSCVPRLLGAYRPDGSLAAIVPLVLVQGRYVRKARLLGFGASNELGALGEPADGAEALRLAVEATRDEWDVFLAENLAGGDWQGRLGSIPVKREASPVVRGPWSTWDEFLATKSSHFRQELGRQERRLEGRGLAYRTVTTTDDLEAALDDLFRLHRANWGAAAVTDFAGLEEFHREFARAAFAQGWLRLHVLELEGRPAAAHLGFRLGEAEWAYQIGRDPSEERASLGKLMVCHALRRSIEEGTAEFRLGPGEQAYKSRLATHDDGLDTVGFARGLRGRAALKAAIRRSG